MELPSEPVASGLGEPLARAPIAPHARLRSASSGHSVAHLSTSQRDRREHFLASGQAGLKSRPTDERDDELGRLRAKVGELTMENELLRERARRAEAEGPFGRRRSR